MYWSPASPKLFEPLKQGSSCLRNYYLLYRQTIFSLPYDFFSYLHNLFEYYSILLSFYLEFMATQGNLNYITSDTQIILLCLVKLFRNSECLFWYSISYLTESPWKDPKNNLLSWIWWLSFCPLLSPSFVFMSVSMI